MWATNRPTDRPTNQPTNQPTIQPTNQFRGTELFLRSWYSLGYSANSHQFVDPEFALTLFISARRLSISWAISIQCTSSLSISEESFQKCPSLYVCVFQVFSFPYISPAKCCRHLCNPHTCHMPHRSHPLEFDHAKNILWGVQIMNPRTLPFFPEASDSVPHEPKCVL